MGRASNSSRTESNISMIGSRHIQPPGGIGSPSLPLIECAPHLAQKVWRSSGFRRACLSHGGPYRRHSRQVFSKTNASCSRRQDYRTHAPLPFLVMEVLREQFCIGSAMRGYLSPSPIYGHIHLEPWRTAKSSNRVHHRKGPLHAKTSQDHRVEFGLRGHSRAFLAGNNAHYKVRMQTNACYSLGRCISVVQPSLPPYRWGWLERAIGLPSGGAFAFCTKLLANLQAIVGSLFIGKAGEQIIARLRK